MDWANERWVRLYTRDTADWAVLSWEARSLWMHLLRKFDRSGIIQLGRHGLKGVAASVGMPLDVVERAIPELIEDGCLVERDGCLVSPNYLPANETPASPAQRTKEWRERVATDRRNAALNGETKRLSNVTRRDAARRAVTARDEHASARDPIRSDPSDPSDPKEEREGVSSPTAPPLRSIGKTKCTAEEYESVRVVLSKLSERSGREYRPTTEEHAKGILQLLRRGHTELELRMVVWDRGNRWAEDPEMDQYLRPSTLFRRSKFAEYLAQAKVAYDADQRKARQRAEPRQEGGLVIPMPTMEGRR